MPSDENQYIEVKKLQEEIRSLRLQRFLLLLATLGSVISFIVANYANIVDILYPSPQISVSISDPFLRANGVIEVQKLNSGKWEKEISTSAKESEEWITLPEGSFKVRLLFNDEAFDAKQVQLRKGDSRIIKFEDMLNGVIKVKVKRKTQNILPNTPLQLEVASSGRGYIWVFDITPEKQLSLIYPDAGSEPSTHEIFPESKYRIPDTRNFGVFSGDAPGMERLLFLVTATPNESLALSIASNFSGSTTAKAQGGVVEVDWGAFIESYDIKFPYRDRE